MAVVQDFNSSGCSLKPQLNNESSELKSKLWHQRWQAVLQRDKNADGEFVYAIRTTGIYCRPICPSRRPKSSNVEFYNDAAEAQKAGFRACYRCMPEIAASPHQMQIEKITQACRLIESSSRLFGLDELAASCELSPSHFHRLFKKIIGLTPRAYAAACRNDRIRQRLAETNSTITQAVYDSGYNDGSRFYADSKRALGMTATKYKNGAPDIRIEFAIGQSSLGSVLVASTGKGVCAILLGDDPQKLANDLQDRFPKAELIGDNPDYDEIVATVIGFVEHERMQFPLPLDLQGTSFQQRVWKELCNIQAGETISYSELAKRIGNSKAVRAVAGACAANKVAIAVPCHRVVRNDGSLSGYRWGVERKKALLEREIKPQGS